MPAVHRHGELAAGRRKHVDEGAREEGAELLLLRARAGQQPLPPAVGRRVLRVHRAPGAPAALCPAARGRQCSARPPCARGREGAARHLRGWASRRSPPSRARPAQPAPGPAAPQRPAPWAPRACAPPPSAWPQPARRPPPAGPGRRAERAAPAAGCFREGQLARPHLPALRSARPRAAAATRAGLRRRSALVIRHAGGRAL